MGGKSAKFTESLNYPSKKYREYAMEPASVPSDPLITKFTPLKGAAVSPQHFAYSVYFTAFDVRDYGKHIKDYMKMFAPLGVKKVYLEIYRDGYYAPESLVSEAKKNLEKEGYTVSGGFTPTHLSDRVGYNEIPAPTSCYTDRVALKKLKEITQKAAAIFNEIIIDSWFFTVCTCPSCVKAKGNREWESIRPKLIYDAAKNYIVEPAKEVRKKVNLVIKFPQWYQDYLTGGYDMDKLIPLFDEAAVGTETRDFHQTQYMPVHGQLLFRFFKSMGGEKVRKAWFDPYICTKETFAEQAYQSVLAGAEELILFCAGILPQPNVREMVENLAEVTEKIDRLRSFNKLFTIPVIKKAHATGEAKLVSYLMMLGVPCYLTAETKLKEKMAIITAKSGEKKDYVRIFNDFVAKEKDIFITINAAKEIKKYFDIEKLSEVVKVDTIRFGGRDHAVDSNVFIDYDIKNGKTMMIANSAYHIVSYFKVKESMVYVFNVPYTTDEITDNTGIKINAGYRFMLRNPAFKECFKQIFSTFSNVNLFDKVKTYYKYHI